MNPEISILDPKGKWYKWTGLFQYHDPDSGHTLLPGVVTKVVLTDSMKRQDVLIEVEDPLAEPKPAKK